MSRKDNVIAAYEAWDPDEESSTELAERLGISKARLYQILEREGIIPKARRPLRKSFTDMVVAARSDPPGSEAEMTIVAMQRMLNSLLEEITQLRKHLAEYRERYGPLDP